MGWLSPDELLSVGDDRQLLKWNLITGESAVVATLPENVYPTDLRWCPRVVGGAKKSTTETFVLASSDGG